MIIKKRAIWYIFSSALFLLSLISLTFYKLPFGIDFTGGNIAEIKYFEPISNNEIKELLKSGGVEANVQPSGANTFSIKFSTNNLPVTQPEEGSVANDSQTLPQKNLVSDVLGEKGEVLSFDTVGPAVSQTLQKRAILAVLYASLGIIIYLAWAFRSAAKIASSWTFGVIAIIALIHDITIVTGVFSLVGHFYNQLITVDTYFITAILTILGYSVNDTIIVFDRMREVARRHPELTVEEIATKSVYNTLGRSLNTSLTVLLVLLTMLLLGGESIFSFLLALVLGVLVGTYSSIFIAAPLLVSWHNHRLKKAGK